MPSETPDSEPSHVPLPLALPTPPPEGGGGSGAVHAGSVAAGAAAPVAGRQMPFPGGLTFESQTARSDGRCTTGDRRRDDEQWRGAINLVPGSCV